MVNDGKVENQNDEELVKLYKVKHIFLIKNYTIIFLSIKN